MVSVHEVLAIDFLNEEDLLVDVVVNCEDTYLASADGYVIEPFVEALPTCFFLLL